MIKKIRRENKMDKELKIFITVIIFAGCYIMFDVFCSIYIRHNMQHQIDELRIENMKQNMRIGILESK